MPVITLRRRTRHKLTRLTNKRPTGPPATTFTSRLESPPHETIRRAADAMRNHPYFTNLHNQLTETINITQCNERPAWPECETL